MLLLLYKSYSDFSSFTYTHLCVCKSFCTILSHKQACIFIILVNVLNGFSTTRIYHVVLLRPPSSFLTPSLTLRNLSFLLKILSFQKYYIIGIIQYVSPWDFFGVFFFFCSTQLKFLEIYLSCICQQFFPFPC